MQCVFHEYTWLYDIFHEIYSCMISIVKTRSSKVYLHILSILNSNYLPKFKKGAFSWIYKIRSFRKMLSEWIFRKGFVTTVENTISVGMRRFNPYLPYCVGLVTNRTTFEVLFTYGTVSNFNFPKTNLIKWNML